MNGNRFIETMRFVGHQLELVRSKRRAVDRIVRNGGIGRSADLNDVDAFLRLNSDRLHDVVAAFDKYAGLPGRKLHPGRESVLETLVRGYLTSAHRKARPFEHARFNRIAHGNGDIVGRGRIERACHPCAQRLARFQIARIDRYSTGV